MIALFSLLSLCFLGLSVLLPVARAAMGDSVSCLIGFAPVQMLNENGEAAPKQIAPKFFELLEELGNFDFQKLRAPGRKVRIINTMSRRSLYAQKGSDWDIGVGASSFQDGPFADAVWELQPVQSQDSTYRIVNSHSQRCLYAQVDKDGSDGFGASFISHPDWPDSHWHYRVVEMTGHFNPSFSIENDFSKRCLRADNQNWDRGLGARLLLRPLPEAQWKIVSADWVALLALYLQVLADVANAVQYSNPNVAKVYRKVHKILSDGMFNESAMESFVREFDEEKIPAFFFVVAEAPIFLQRVDEWLTRAKAVELIHAVIEGDDIDLQPVKLLMDDLVKALVDFISSDPMKRCGQLMPSELLKWAES